MELPPKKAKRIYCHEREVFLLILPYLFPGWYDEWPLAFRTYLSLCGTSRSLRYWNVLRRWVAYLAPDRMKLQLASHSFPCGPRLIDYQKFQLHCYELLRIEGAVEDENPVFNSEALGSNFFLKTNYEEGAQMETEIGGSPFFGLVRCECRAKTIRCFFARTFSEMALFVYAACNHVTDNPEDGWLVVAQWKTTKFEAVYFTVGNREHMLERYLLGRLKRIGLTAPQEIGFHEGSLEWTAYAWFCKHCDTTGTRSKITPAQRLRNFVVTWFPTNTYLSVAQTKGAPYDFQIHSVY